MNDKLDIVRALKDKDYYDSLSPDQKALVPNHPAGEIALNDEDLRSISGGLGEEIEATGTGSTRCFCSPTETGTGEGTCSC